eukprot:12407392-Karenia_brevis.AAC.1
MAGAECYAVNGPDPSPVMENYTTTAQFASLTQDRQLQFSVNDDDVAVRTNLMELKRKNQQPPGYAQ